MNVSAVNSSSGFPVTPAGTAASQKASATSEASKLAAAADSSTAAKATAAVKAAAVKVAKVKTAKTAAAANAAKALATKELAQKSELAAAGRTAKASGPTGLGDKVDRRG